MSKNNNLICRICLKVGAVKSLFDTVRKVDSLKVTCSEMMVTCATVTAEINDGLPENICTKCILNLKIAFAFRKLCEKSYNILLEQKTHIGQLECKDEPEGNENSDINGGDICKIDDVLEDIKLKDELKEETFEEYDNFTDKIADLNFLQDADDFNYVESINEEMGISEQIVPNDVNRKLRKRKKAAEVKPDKDLKLSKVKKKQTSEQLLGLDIKSMKTSEGFQCNQCPRVFRCRRTFVRHLEKHLGIKSFFCEICQKYYAKEWTHMQTHLHPPTKKYKCDVCDKMYAYKASLAIHTISHSQLKPHVCTDCGKAFKRLDRLRWHMNIHTGLKEYICQFCSKDFFSHKNLITHIKYRHTNDRKYQCTRCDKRFVTSNCLHIHEKRHLGIKKYHCDYCDKSFVTKSAKECHHKMHTKEKPHPCRVCGLKFGRTDHRKRHENTAHGLHQVKTLL